MVTLNLQEMSARNATLGKENDTLRLEKEILTSESQTLAHKNRELKFEAGVIEQSGKEMRKYSGVTVGASECLDCPMLLFK